MFLKELETLLKKYNATISFEVDPRTELYGNFYDSHLAISFTDPDTKKLVTINIPAECWDIEAKDFKNFLKLPEQNFKN